MTIGLLFLYNSLFFLYNSLSLLRTDEVVSISLGLICLSLIADRSFLGEGFAYPL